MKHLVLLLCLLAMPLHGQLLTENTEFDRGDTLRGTLGPDRTWFNVHYYELHLAVDPENRTIQGYNDVYFEVLESHPTMQLDLFADIMRVDSITMNGKTLDYKREYNAVMINTGSLKKGSKHKLRFAYHGTPIAAENPPWDGGFVWRKDSNDKHFIGVACEGLGASSWWPNKDHLSDEPDSMMLSVAVPSDLVMVGNGTLRSKKREGDYMRYNWFVANPINNYNISVNIGDYGHFSDVHKYEDGEELMIDYYVLQENMDTAMGHLPRWTLPMMDCFEQYLGKYPFMEDGMALVETPYLGMEHQSAIAYGNGYQHGYAGMDFSRIGLDFDYIIIHETGHEWWGNAVSCSDMADLWIHEGFCTYSEALYVECLHGADTAQLYINAKKRGVDNKKPIQGRYGVNEEGDGDMYAKGSLLMNTIRHTIDNDEAWFKILKQMPIDFKYTPVDAEDVISYINKFSGMKLNNIFEQYLKYPAIPRFEYSTTQKRNCTILKYRWDTDAASFDMPFDYKDAKGEWQRLQPTSEWQEVKIKKVLPENLELGENRFYVELKEVPVAVTD